MKAVKKLALFVEGQTEQIFLKRLIFEIAGIKNIRFECKTVLKGGILGDTLWLRGKTGSRGKSSHTHSVLIVDCMGDERVLSTIRDQSQSLSRSGYSLIIGLRDLYPIPFAELEDLKARLSRLTPKNIPAHVLLAVSEIEAWFLQEYHHYRFISPRLNPETFLDDFGFDPIRHSAEKVHHPAALLQAIYSSAGVAYRKKRHHIQRTVDVLDYAELYLNHVNKLPHLRDFVKHIDGFLK